MNSTTEPHADRPQEPILSEPKSYAPQRARWPGLLAVAVLAAAAIGGMVVTGQQDSKPSTAPPDRSVQAPQPGTDAKAALPAEDARVAQPAGSEKPRQP